MYCISCGKENSENAKFCMFCGKEIQEIVNINDFSNDIENEIEIVPEKPLINLPEDKEFEIGTHRLVYDGETVLYNQFYVEFIKAGKKDIDNFERYYVSNIQTCEDIYNKAIVRFSNLLRSAEKKALAIMQRNNASNICLEDIQGLVEEKAIASMEKTIKPVTDRVEKLAKEFLEVEARRNVKKLGRGHWEGGGFGLKGAIKGAVMAGALNLGTNAVRGIGDAIISASDKARFQVKQNELICDNRTLDAFIGGISSMYAIIFRETRRIMINEGLITRVSFDDKTLKGNMEYLWNKRQTDNSLVQKCEQALIQCIQRNPYEEDYYSRLYRIRMDYKSDIIRIATYFGCDFESVADEIKKKRLDEIKNYSESTSAQVKRKKDEYEAVMNYLTMEERNNAIDEIDRLGVILLPMVEKEKHDRIKQEREKRSKKFEADFRRFETAQLELESAVNKYGANKYHLLTNEIFKFNLLKAGLPHYQSEEVRNNSSNERFMLDDAKVVTLSEIYKVFKQGYSSTGGDVQNFIFGLRGELSLSPNKYCISQEEKDYRDQVKNIYGTSMSRAAACLPLGILEVPSLENSDKAISNRIEKGIEFCNQIKLQAFQWDSYLTIVTRCLSECTVLIEEVVDRRKRKSRKQGFSKTEIELIAYYYELINLVTMIISVPLLSDEGEVLKDKERKILIDEYLGKFNNRTNLLFLRIKDDFEVREKKQVFSLLVGDKKAWLFALVIGVLGACLISKTAPTNIILITGLVLLLSAKIMLTDIRNNDFLIVKKIAHLFFTLAFALAIFRFNIYLTQWNSFWFFDAIVGVILFFFLMYLDEGRNNSNYLKVLFSITGNLFAVVVELFLRYAAEEGFFDIPAIIAHVGLSIALGAVLFEKKE